MPVPGVRTSGLAATTNMEVFNKLNSIPMVEQSVGHAISTYERIKVRYTNIQIFELKIVKDLVTKQNTMTNTGF